MHDTGVDILRVPLALPGPRLAAWVVWDESL